MAENVQTEKKSGKGLIIALVVIVILLIIGMSVMATMLLNSGGKDSEVSAERTSWCNRDTSWF